MKNTSETIISYERRNKYMSKYEKVSEALSNKTRETENWVMLTRNVDARFHGKRYGIINVVTRNLQTAYRTLNEVINDYELDI